MFCFINADGNENTNVAALERVWTPQDCVVCVHKYWRGLRHDLGMLTQGQVSTE